MFTLILVVLAASAVQCDSSDFIRSTEVEGISNLYGDDVDVNTTIYRISLPDLSIPLQFEKHKPFSVFIPQHRKVANKLIDILMGLPTYEDFLSVSIYARHRMNFEMFNYALTVATTHRNDTRNPTVPPLVVVFPEKYIDKETLFRIQEDDDLSPEAPRTKPEPIVISPHRTGSNFDDEHRLAYWREDIGMNQQHWHWHISHPRGALWQDIIEGRRGESFYYLHQQITARYNFERLSNRLSRVEPLVDWHEPIPEGYFSKLDSQVASRTWPGRPSGSRLRNIKRPDELLSVTVQDLERWRDRIYEAIHVGAIVDPRGQRVELTEEDGIDILGNIVGANYGAIPMYGDLHNLGHLVIAYSHDPDGRHLEPFGVMGDQATAMRDPIFYRWHALLNSIFREYKDTLPPYSEQQLDFPDVEVTDVKLITPNRTVDTLSTFWQQSEINVVGGLDFGRSSSILVQYTHLNHTPITYEISVNNQNNETQNATVRIFMAPKFDERGLPLIFYEQKQLMIEMDMFTTTLPPGSSTIRRRSGESTVTVRYHLDQEKPIDESCGWPKHLLIPKGNEQGFPAELFVMVSDFNGDNFETDEDSPASYCGAKNGRNADNRSMGFPFDRSPREGADILARFLTGNMATTDVTIFFKDSE